MLYLSQAQAVTLTVAQAFKVAFEFWQASKEGKSASVRCKSLRYLFDISE